MDLTLLAGVGFAIPVAGFLVKVLSDMLTHQQTIITEHLSANTKALTELSAAVNALVLLVKVRERDG